MFKASESVGDGVSRNAFHHPKLLVSVGQTMGTLCVGRTKLYELIAAGELEIVKIGTATRVVVSSIEAYVDRLRAQANRHAA
jgi:excisionase family DNA binding protein